MTIRRRSRFLRTITILTPLLVIIICVWLPVLKKYHVPRAHIDNREIQQAQSIPDDRSLREIASFDYGILGSGLEPIRFIATADGILSGTLELPGQAPRTIRLSVDENAVESGDSSWQLSFSSFIVPSILLHAYDATGRQRYLDAARDFIHSWIEYEHGRWLPRGFMWNDHAMAARVAVIAEFWRLYRSSTAFDVETARTLLEYVVEIGDHLAHKAQYTFATNHGIMQNVALLQLAVAFPEMPSSKARGDLGMRRISEQIPFFLNREGFILEHSPGYHAFGVSLLSAAFRYLSLRGEPISAEWRSRHDRGIQILRSLLRPNGSLPPIGDTSAKSLTAAPYIVDFDANGFAANLRRSEPLVPTRTSISAPGAGYSVWWHAGEQLAERTADTQTTIAWSNYPGHGHKHPDEMSVTLWSEGVEWWRSVGYWPYTAADRNVTDTWLVSNAPHVVGEPARSERTARILGSGISKSGRFIDLERAGKNNINFRRQVLYVAPKLWIVIDDHIENRDRPVQIVWLSDSRVIGERDPEVSWENAFRLREAESGQGLWLQVLGSSQLTARLVRGQKDEPVGWVESEGKVRSAPAVVVEQSASRGWIASVWFLDKAGPSPFQVQTRMLDWSGPTQWRIAVFARKGTIEISRVQQRIVITRPPQFAGTPVSEESAIEIVDYSGVADIVGEATKAFAEAREKRGGQTRDLIDYRYKISAVVLFLLLLQESVFFCCKYFGFGIRRTFLCLVAIVWIGGGIWLSEVYFI